VKRSELKRVTPLKRTTALTASPLARSALHAAQVGHQAPVRRRRPKDTSPTSAVAAAVLLRDEHACARCSGAAHGQRGVDYSIHHRKLRSQGVDNSLPNLVTLCGDGVCGCHGWAHHNRKAAEVEGWIVRSGFNPLLVPIFHARYGQIFLLADGSWASRPLTPTLTAEEA
jgi:5-methylcytosine-specific restriction endonuclease McrA